jgi:hypothetical protein
MFGRHGAKLKVNQDANFREFVVLLTTGIPELGLGRSTDFIVTENGRIVGSGSKEFMTIENFALSLKSRYGNGLAFVKGRFLGTGERVFQFTRISTTTIGKFHSARGFMVKPKGAGIGVFRSDRKVVGYTVPTWKDSEREQGIIARVYVDSTVSAPELTLVAAALCAAVTQL